MRRVANGSFNIEINTANDEAFDALGDDVAADDKAGRMRKFPSQAQCGK